MAVIIVAFIISINNFNLTARIFSFSEPIVNVRKDPTVHKTPASYKVSRLSDDLKTSKQTLVMLGDCLNVERTLIALPGDPPCSVLTPLVEAYEVHCNPVLDRADALEVMKLASWDVESFPTVDLHNMTCSKE